MQKIFTIPPHQAFLQTLVSAIADQSILPDWSRDDPFWLSDITIYLPTQRASAALSNLFLTHFGPAMLLPDIRTLGGEFLEEEIFLPPFDGAPLPNAISAAERQLVLGMQVEKFLASGEYEGAKASAAQVLQMADALATLIDDFKTEQVPIENLKQVEDEEASSHWQYALKFLEIALKAWPEILSQSNLVDSADLRNLKLEKQARNLAQKRGPKPVIIAGTTGSIPATAHLIKAVMDLPNGCVVLPGLDQDLDKQTRDQFKTHLANPHAHPQYGLLHLLDVLKTPPAAVKSLAPLHANQSDDASPQQRTQLLQYAMALPTQSALWHTQAKHLASDKGKFKALAPITLINARHQDEEALSVALAAKSYVERGKSVGIISPDRNLARRIMAHLERFALDVDDSAGTPLFHTRAGRLLRQILALAKSGGAAVDLMSLLHNRDFQFGRSRAEISALSAFIRENLIDGLPPCEELSELQLRLKNLGAQSQTVSALSEIPATMTRAVAEFLDQIENALRPLINLFASEFFAPDLMRVLATIYDLIIQAEDDDSGTTPFGTEQWHTFVYSIDNARFAGPQLAMQSVEAALESFLSAISVRQHATNNAQLAIYGRLEARLQHHDVMFLSALNEAIWPEIADPGPWLGRQMRIKAGLMPPERAHGLAAHDFIMAMGNPEVVLSQAQRVGTSPAEPSRYLLRLQAFIGEYAADELVSKGDVWTKLAREFDDTAPPVPATRPGPKPPANVRARRISFSQAEQLMRSPYNIYARSTLSLNAIDPLGQQIGGRERGTILHEIFANFVTSGHDVNAQYAKEMLLSIAEQSYILLGAESDQRQIALRRFERIADKYLEFERDRNEAVKQRFAEISMTHTFETARGPFTLHGRADRIDVMRDGTCEIFDFKTGETPSAAEMKDFQAPQLPLEAFVMAERGFQLDAEQQQAYGMKNVPPLKASALKYIKIAQGPNAFIVTDFACDKGHELDDVVAKSQENLLRHIAHFLENDDVPMIADLRPKSGQKFAGTYDQLARKGEWSLGGLESDQ